MTSPLRGPSTVNFFPADHVAARKWYTELLGLQPYFERPGYVEFRLGDYQHELGIIDSNYVPGVQSNNSRAGGHYFAGPKNDRWFHLPLRAAKG